jgi:hypothetical protein
LTGLGVSSDWSKVSENKGEKEMDEAIVSPIIYASIHLDSYYTYTSIMTGIYLSSIYSCIYLRSSNPTCPHSSSVMSVT